MGDALWHCYTNIRWPVLNGPMMCHVTMCCGARHLKPGATMDYNGYSVHPDTPIPLRTGFGRSFWRNVSPRATRSWVLRWTSALSPLQTATLLRYMVRFAGNVKKLSAHNSFFWLVVSSHLKKI